MAYDYPFQLLNPDSEIPLLASSTDAIDAYINCLALLQGVLLPLSGNYPAGQAFDDPDMVKDAIRESIHKIPRALVGKIIKNEETAFDILNESKIKEGVRQAGQVATRATVHVAIDSYLTALVTQYQILRQAGSSEVPQHQNKASQDSNEVSQGAASGGTAEKAVAKAAGA